MILIKSDLFVSERKVRIKRQEVLDALNSGEFDNIRHTYQPYSDNYSKNSYQIEMKVANGIIEKTTTTSGKFFDGKENCNRQVE